MALREQRAAPHEPGHIIEHPADFQVRVKALTDESEEVRSFELERIDGTPFPLWEPGAHVDVLISEEIERQFSLCGNPEAATWRIAVLNEPHGRGGSAWMHEDVAEGDVLRIRGPRNNFPLVPDAFEYRLIAGGIGITPLLPMVRVLEARGASWSLLYGGRKRASMAFLSEVANYGERVAIRPEDEMGLLDLGAVVGRPRAGAVVYCCGPEPLLQAVEHHLKSWPPNSLHIERFKPAPGALDGDRSSFEVVCVLSGVTLNVGVDQSIAEAAEAAGIEIETSCREGTCGTCETGVLEGIPDHRDSFLQPDERTSNETMMICCSRAKSASLVLDL
jgi:ferredoxin-NADP reductase